jgi:hypothetical protein
MAETVGEMAAKRAGEPEFLMGGSAAPAKRSGKKGAASADAMADMQPMARKVYTNFSISEGHREYLEDLAWHRKRKRLTNKFDMSGVLRDFIDYCMANEKEVGAWIARQHKSQGNR